MNKIFRFLARLTPQWLRDLILRRTLRGQHTNLTLGTRCTIFQSSFGKNVDIASDVTIILSQLGDATYIGPRSVICHAEIGKYCSIAPEVYIGLGSHPSNFVSTHPLFYLTKPERGWNFADKNYFSEFAETKIGNDVWIGLRAAIKDGVTIGDGAIIGAGAVVVNDVPPYTIFGGVPAKQIGARFTQQEIDFLLSFKWWERSDTWLRENHLKFHNIKDFMKEFAKEL